MRYRIIGPRQVAGVAPGGVLDATALTGLDVAALVAAGHLAPLVDEGQADGADLDGLTVPQLRAYAADHHIDLGDAVRKAELLAAIRAAQGGDHQEEGER